MIDWSTVSAQIISCDVFDTLLCRNHISEPSRVGLIARRAADMLALERGMTIDVDAIRRARTEVQRQGYRALDMLDPCGEIRFGRMLDGMVALLGLAEADADILARAEIAIEKTQLSPNAPLLDWLAQRSADGVRIIAISDTWHDGATIRGLLDTVAPGHPVSAVYTSADLDASKRSAKIFPIVVAREGIPAGAFFHIGDDEQADDRMARKSGLQAYRILPPRWTMLARKVDGVTARLRRPLPYQ